MFFSTQICVDKTHPLHSMWLLSCYLEDNRARKKQIPDHKLRRSDLVKIIKELTKMFIVDGRRRGFALAMNTDMFNAVVYTLEFKAIDLLSESRKLLVTINKKNPFGADNQEEDLMTINLDTNLTTSKTTVLQTFPGADALKMRFNQITMADYDVENPTMAQNINQDDFGHMTFDDIEAIERNSQEGGHRDSTLLGDFEDPSFLPGIMDANPLDPNLLPANISPAQQFNNLVDFMDLPPQDMAALDQDADLLFQSHQVINDTTGAATFGNEDGLADDITATRRDDESIVNRNEDINDLESGLPVPNIVLQRPSNEGQDVENIPVLTPPPQAMDINDLAGPAIHNPSAVDDIHEQAAPLVDEAGHVEAANGPLAPVVEVNIIPETQSDEERVELPGPVPATKPATKKKNRRKKRKLLVDEVTSLTRSEIQKQLVFIDSETTTRTKAKKAPNPRTSEQLFSAPMTQFYPQSELSEFWNLSRRSLITKRGGESSSSSSSSDDEPESRYRRDRELSSLRNGLQVDLSSIPNVSGVLRDIGEDSNLDLPGFLQDQQQDLQQDQSLGASELRNATEVTAGQADIGSPSLASERRERSKDDSFHIQDMEKSVSEIRGTSDITGGMNMNEVMGPPQPLDLNQDEQVDLLQVNEPSDLLQVNEQPPALDVTPQDQDMAQVPPMLDDEVPLQESPQAGAEVDPYADVNLLALNITAPNTSAGELLDKMRDVAGGDNSLFFSSVCPASSTDKLMAGVAFFNMLKLQRSAYVECHQNELQDDIKIKLLHKDGSEYGSSSEYANTAESSVYSS